jgi:ADP-ribosylglycohydrolase
VPEAIFVFLVSNSYEETIRNAVSIGGDTDTIACMSGGIAEAFYGSIPENIMKEGLKRIPKEFEEVIARFRKVTGNV